MPARQNSAVPSEIIGRESELNILQNSLRAAREDKGRCVLVTGEAGIGKSRLVSEIRRAAADQVVVLEGHCLEQDASFPYAPWVDALRAFFAPRSAVEIRESLGPLASEFVKLLPELALLIPQLLPTPLLDREAEKRRLFEVLARFCSNLAQSNLVVIILEDLHWSDELSLELMCFIGRRISDLPILILGTYRPEDAPPHLKRHLFNLNREHLTEEIQLAPLIRPDVERKVRTLLATEKAIAVALLDEVMSLTEGIPFFIEEVIKMLVEAGSIDLTDSQWQRTTTGQLQVPRSLQSVIERRVNQLSSTAQRVLSLAAIVGQRFDFGLLQELAAYEEHELLQILKELIAAQLIVEESADRFAFRHA